MPSKEVAEVEQERRSLMAVEEAEPSLKVHAAGEYVWYECLACGGLFDLHGYLMHDCEKGG